LCEKRQPVDLPISVRVSVAEERKSENSLILSGWLYKTTRYEAANALKRESRRRRHERAAAAAAAAAAAVPGRESPMSTPPAARDDTHGSGVIIALMPDCSGRELLRLRLSLMRSH
jgi:hypothetical protein